MSQLNAIHVKLSSNNRFGWWSCYLKITATLCILIGRWK